MKKILIIILIIFTSFLTSCGGNEVIENQGEIVFSFPSEYLSYFPYQVPTYKFTFSGNLNTIVPATTTNRKAFGKNDDFVVSDILKNLFIEYQNKSRLTTKLLNVDAARETKMNSLDDNLEQISHNLRVEEDKVYNEISYLHLENGLILSFEYRRFNTLVDNNVVTYYAWRYTKPLNAVLHYPLMVIKNDNLEKQFLIVTLPPNVFYSLGLTEKLPISTILKDDKYITSYYRSFFYPEYNDDPRYNQGFDLDKNIELVKGYYNQYYQGRLEGNNYLFTYLNINFKITFKETQFIIDYLGLAS